MLLASCPSRARARRRSRTRTPSREYEPTAGSSDSRSEAQRSCADALLVDYCADEADRRTVPECTSRRRRHSRDSGMPYRRAVRVRQTRRQSTVVAMPAAMACGSWTCGIERPFPRQMAALPPRGVAAPLGLAGGQLVAGVKLAPVSPLGPAAPVAPGGPGPGRTGGPVRPRTAAQFASLKSFAWSSES